MVAVAASTEEGDAAATVAAAPAVTALPGEFASAHLKLLRKKGGLWTLTTGGGIILLDAVFNII